MAQARNQESGMAFRPFPIDNERTKSELRKRLHQLIVETEDPILNGVATNFDDYRYRVGMLRGYRTVMQELDSIEKQE